MNRSSVVSAGRGTEGFPPLSPSAISSSLNRTDSPSARNSRPIAESGSPADRRPEIESTRAAAVSTKVFVPFALRVVAAWPGEYEYGFVGVPQCDLHADRSGSVRHSLSATTNAATSL